MRILCFTLTLSFYFTLPAKHWYFSYYNFASCFSILKHVKTGLYNKFTQSLITISRPLANNWFGGLYWTESKRNENYKEVKKKEMLEKEENKEHNNITF